MSELGLLPTKRTVLFNSMHMRVLLILQQYKFLKNLGAFSKFYAPERWLQSSTPGAHKY